MAPPGPQEDAQGHAGATRQPPRSTWQGHAGRHPPGAPFTCSRRSCPLFLPQDAVASPGQVAALLPTASIPTALPPSVHSDPPTAPPAGALGLRPPPWKVLDTPRPLLVPLETGGRGARLAVWASGTALPLELPRPPIGVARGRPPLRLPPLRVPAQHCSAACSHFHRSQTTFNAASHAQHSAIAHARAVFDKQNIFSLYK